MLGKDASAMMRSGSQTLMHKLPIISAYTFSYGSLAPERPVRA